MSQTTTGKVKLTEEKLLEILKNAEIKVVEGWGACELSKDFLSHTYERYLTEKQIKSIRETGLKLSSYRTNICEENDLHVVLHFEKEQYLFQENSS